MQLNACGDYASLNMYSHRKDTELNQIVCAVHARKTKCLFFPLQPVGWIVQVTICRIYTAEAACNFCAQVESESSPAFTCSSLGAASELWDRGSMIISLTALSQSHSALSRTSVGEYFVSLDLVSYTSVWVLNGTWICSPGLNSSEISSAD